MYLFFLQSRIERMGENTAILRGSVSKISDDMPLYDVFYFYRILLFLQKGKGNVSRLSIIRNRPVILYSITMTIVDLYLLLITQKTAKKCFKLRGGISLPDLVNEGILETDGEMVRVRRCARTHEID